MIPSWCSEVLAAVATGLGGAEEMLAHTPDRPLADPPSALPSLKDWNFCCSVDDRDASLRFAPLVAALRWGAACAEPRNFTVPAIEEASSLPSAWASTTKNCFFPRGFRFRGILIPLVKWDAGLQSCKVPDATAASGKAGI